MSGPYAYPDPHYAPGWVPPRPATDGVSIAALVTGVFGLGPVAVVLGLIGVRRTRGGARSGRGLAVAGIVLGGVGTLVWAALAALGIGTVLASRPLPSDVQRPVTARAVQLVTGNCLAQLPPDGRVDQVRVVPCADEHVAQVVTSYDFGDGATWPGEAQASARVAATCDLTADEQEQGLRMVAWAPTARSWARGDRTGLCVAVLPEPATGSLLAGGAGAD